MSPPKNTVPMNSPNSLPMTGILMSRMSSLKKVSTGSIVLPSLLQSLTSTQLPARKIP